MNCPQMILITSRGLVVVAVAVVVVMVPEVGQLHKWIGTWHWGPLVVLRIHPVAVAVAVIVRRGEDLGCLCRGRLGNLPRQVMLGVPTMIATTTTTTAIAIVVVAEIMVGNRTLETGGIRILTRRPDRKISIENHSCFICKFGCYHLLLSIEFWFHWMAGRFANYGLGFSLCCCLFLMASWLR